MPSTRTSHDDVELGDLENDAFLPNSSDPKQGSKTHEGFSKYLPRRIQDFLENLSKIKVAIMLLVIFVLLLAWVALANGNVEIVIPKESLELSEKTAHDLLNTTIPDFVLTYAPLVFLDKSDIYYPSDLASHIANTQPTLNFSSVKPAPDPLTLDNLDKLNALGGDKIYLTSTSNVIKLPEFLHGEKPNKHTLQTHKATSCVVIVVEKEDGIVDAFYMYFYTFNAGPSALGHVAGNHLGDWEHNMVRFKDGLPTAVWFSQHEYGAAYTYQAVQKSGNRPINYSAKGSHANYAIAAAHDLHQQNEKVPSHLAYDKTSAGKLWDPTLSAYFYTFSPANQKFTPVGKATPVGYLYFNGNWGDEEYGDEVEGQESFHGFHKWTGGPQGPLFKHLDRKEVCLPNRPKCTILDKL